MAVLTGLKNFSWEKYTAALEAKGYTVKLKLDVSVTVRGYTILSGNSAYKSSIISRDLTPSKIQETWEKMRPENRYGQRTYEERLAFATSDEGKDYLFPLGLTLGGKRYETKASGGAVKAFHEESRAIERTIRLKKQATSFGQPSFFSSGKSMPPPPSLKTAEAEVPLPTPTGAATRTRMTSSGPPLLPKGMGNG